MSSFRKLFFLLPCAVMAALAHAEGPVEGHAGYAVAVAASTTPHESVSVLETEHFLVLTQAPSPGLNASDQAAAESTYACFTEAFDAGFWGTRLPEDRLVLMVFPSPGNLRSYALRAEGVDVTWPGYFSIASNRVAVVRHAEGGYEGTVVLAAGGDAREDDAEAGASAASVAGYTRLSLRDQDACLTHEVAHLLAYNSGLQNRFRHYPLWLSEGLATTFERHEGQRSWGPTAVNRPRALALKEMERREQLVPLDEFVVLMSPPGEGWGASHRFYAQAWGLFHYLYTHEREGLRSYYRHLNASGAMPSRAAMRGAFVAAFGDPAALQSRWVATIPDLDVRWQRPAEPMREQHDGGGVLADAVALGHDDAVGVDGPGK